MEKEKKEGDERYATDAEYGRREREKERIQTTRQQNNEKRKEIQRAVSVCLLDEWNGLKMALFLLPVSSSFSALKLIKLTKQDLFTTLANEEYYYSSR